MPFWFDEQFRVSAGMETEKNGNSKEYAYYSERHNFFQ